MLFLVVIGLSQRMPTLRSCLKTRRTKFMQSLLWWVTEGQDVGHGQAHHAKTCRTGPLLPCLTASRIRNGIKALCWYQRPTAGPHSSKNEAPEDGALGAEHELEGLARRSRLHGAHVAGRCGRAAAAVAQKAEAAAQQRLAGEQTPATASTCHVPVSE